MALHPDHLSVITKLLFHFSKQILRNIRSRIFRTRRSQDTTYLVSEVNVLHFIIMHNRTNFPLNTYSDRHCQVFALATQKCLCLDPRISCYDPGQFWCFAVCTTRIGEIKKQNKDSTLPFATSFSD